MTLDIITHRSLGTLKHGFFGRKGGASSGIFEGLNCGYGSSDMREAVTMNRNRVAEAMDVDENALVGVHQVHSADVLTITDASEPRPDADAMVTNVPGLALSILTADCQPVLFADHNAGVVGAAHAGWKGALAGVLENTLAAMEAIGADRKNTVAIIGPTISQRVYEVGPEFLDTFLVEDEEYARFFANGEGDRYLFNLPLFGLHKLREAGIGDTEWTGHCTYSDVNRFYSYRRTTHRKEADYGRLIAAIRL